MTNPYSAELVHSLIQNIYLAGSDANRWHDFLELLRAGVDGANAVFTYIDRRVGGSTVTAAAGIAPEVLRLYREQFASVDPFSRGAAALGPLRPGFIGLAQDLISDDELARTEYYQQFGQRYGCIGGVICVVFADGPLLGALGVNRKPGRYFGQAEVELLRVLVPHLRTSLQIYEGLGQRLQIGSAALATLNHLRGAAFVCDEDARVLHMNVQADARRDLFTRDGRMTVPSRSETDRLRKAIADRARLSVLNGDLAATARVHLVSQRAMAVISPIQIEEHLPLTKRMVGVLITLPPQSTQTVASTLTGLYRLTPAEAAIAAALTSGESLREAARKTGIKYETARTYLKRVFQKTGTGRQAELVRVLLTSVVSSRRLLKNPSV